MCQFGRMLTVVNTYFCAPINNMKFYCLIFCLFSAVLLNAQDIPIIRLPNEVFRNIKKEKDPLDSIEWRWKRGGVNNLHISQGSLSNWAAGGDNFSLSINNYFNYFLFYKNGKHSWDSNLDLYFGLLQSTSLGARKNDDRIDVLSKYGYNFDGFWYVSGLFNFRSQFFDGYTFSGQTATFASTLLSPAYVIVSAGLDYKPNNELSVFISPLTSRSVIIMNNYLADKGLYGVPAGKHFTSEVGFFSSTKYNKMFGKNISYRGRVDLFSNYASKPGNIDMFMTNVISFKITKYLSANYNLDLIYDDDVKLFGDTKDSPALQIKSLLGIGLTLKLDPVVL